MAAPVADTQSATGAPAGTTGDDSDSDSQTDLEPKDFEVYGDSAYADGATLDEQAARGHDMRTKVPPVRNANGYSKDQFSIDPAAGTVTCPAHHTVAIRDGAATAQPASASSVGPARYRRPAPQPVGDGVISIHPHEAALQHAKARQKDPDLPGPSWSARSATSPTAPGAALKPDAADTPAS